MNGADPSAAVVNLNDGGPCDRANTVRGSPTGDWILAVARYSSKLLLSVAVSKSAVMTPKLPRNTHFGLKLYAIPMRGCQFLYRLAASGPALCTIAPLRPVRGSVAFGSNCDCLPSAVWKGDSYDQRTPRLSVRLRIGL